MTDRTFEPMTPADVTAAQAAWVEAVTTQDVDSLLALYDYGTAEAPLLFKPTLANVIRHDEKGARAYFVGGDADYPLDHGFLHNGWKSVTFESAAGPLADPGGLGFKDMGHCSFVNGAGEVTQADYTFAYHKIGGKVLISLHHSSLTWTPPTDA